MADEAALALQPGGSPSAVLAEKESASPPTGEPLRKRPRRDGPGLGRSPGEPDGTAPEREAPAAAGGGPAAAGGEREAQVAAGGEGDNGPGLQILSREPPPVDDLDDDDDDEGEEEEEAAAIGYRGVQRRGRPGLRTPSPSPGSSRCAMAESRAGWGLGAGSAAPHSLPRKSAARLRGCRPGRGSGLPTPSRPPLLPFVCGPPGRPWVLRSRQAGKLS